MTVLNLALRLRVAWGASGGPSPRQEWRQRPRSGTDNLVAKLSEVAEEAEALNWRIRELVIMPVERVPDCDG